MISVRGISKSFGPQQVLKNVSLEIEDGKTIAIVGPSGVGKSVLLKLIMGILAPDEGEVFVFGENMTRARTEQQRNDIRRNLGVLFQSAALFDSLTIYDNVAFGLRERLKLRRREVHRRVVEMMESLSLAQYGDLYPEQVSIGIRKRVGMARSLVMEPKFFLFDEPNTGLDPLVGQEVYDLINLCRKQWGFGGIVVSHELPEVFQVSDRVAMLLHAKVIFDGAPSALIASQDPAVQQFLHGRTDGPIKIQ